VWADTIANGLVPGEQIIETTASTTTSSAEPRETTHLYLHHT
jgi:hypothetical protein